MAIRDTDLNRNFLLLESSCTLQEALEKAGKEGEVYLVVELEGGMYASLLRDELQKGLNGLEKQGERLAMLHARLGELLAPLAVRPVEQGSIELWEAEMARRKSPTESLVVLSNGEVAGLLAPRTREAVVYRSAGKPKGVLSATPESTPTFSKHINIKLIDQDDIPQKPEVKPLQLSQLYTLVLDITDQARQDSILADLFLRYQWKDAENEVTLTVRLESADFEILTDPQKISVPRQGSSTRARFDLRPQREGPGVVNVLFFKEELFIQLLTLKFTVVDGELFSETSAGRTMAAAFTAAPPRHLTLTILQAGDGFNLIMMTGPVAARASLPISRENLANRITALRSVLQEKVVHMQNPGTGLLVYQEDYKIPPKFRDHALRLLAIEGYALYREIFFGPGTDSQTQNVGQRLLELSRRDETLHIQIFSQHFMLPWGLLYLAGDDEFDHNNVHPEWFLGLKHVVEHIPLQQTLQVLSSQIDSREGLAVSLNVNAEIDKKMGAPLVADQLKTWKAYQKQGVRLVERKTASELLEALRSAQSTTDQIIYFYCHAVSNDLKEGGPDGSMLELGSAEVVTLRELKLLASQTRQFPGEPLIFINACESAELSPLFYDGFVPYFLDKGARGVIGTECEVPAVFAKEWANRFFKRLLKGEPLGLIVLDLRKEFFYNEGNILGLLYALYVDGDTRVSPGLEVGD
jgi:hypothetical protein